MRSIRQSLSWNMVSFLIVGISGVLINILIAKYYGVEFLGIFNQIFAVYILLSQIAVFGIHLSAIKYISQYAEHYKVNVIISSAILLTLIIALLVFLFSMNISNLLSSLFDSERVGESWKYIAFGLIFFALNKTILAIINGLQYMRFFAIAQALRYIFALVFISIFLYNGIHGIKLGLIISLSEALLFIILIIFLIKKVKLDFIGTKRWIFKHLRFGYHSFWGATIGELNTRVDTLVLGVFVSDGLVGIYTFALMVFEGFMQVGVVVRNVYNPTLGKLLSEKRYKEVEILIMNVKKKFYFLMSLIAIIGIVIYPYFINLTVGSGFNDSIYIFYILICSVIITAGYLPFDMILNQAGYPKDQSIYRTNIVLINIFFNIIFIPFFGIYGAAVATSIAVVSRIYFLKKIAYKNIGIII